MPNWCENELEVRGTKKAVAKFVKYAKGENGIIDFNRFIPYPAKFAELDEKARTWEKEHPSESWHNRPKDGYNKGGYRWCIDNWGTKWNASHIDSYKPNPEDESYKEQGELIFKFDTAWNPPKPVIKKMAKEFPNLEFTLRYFEQGGAFNGLFRMRNGVVADDKTGEYFGHRGG